MTNPAEHTPDGLGCRRLGPPVPDAAPGSTGLGGLGRICLVVFALNLGLRIALAAVFPLHYKEAYFWEWSQFPSAGYLEHPPAVAWVIRVVGFVFGVRSVFGIRFGALLFGTGSLLLVYRLAIVLFDDRRLAVRALLIALGLPLLNALGVVMLPDAPMMFFHLLFLCLFASALRTRRGRYWCLAGLAAGAAMLSKLTFVITLVVCLGYLICSRRNRFWLKRPMPYVGAAIALGLCFPFIRWNAIHGWATLRLHLWDRHYAAAGLNLLGAAKYVAEQLANTSLFLAIPLVGVLFVRVRHLPEAWRGGFQLLRAHAASVLAVFLIVGAVSQTHPHWTVLSYPSAAIMLAALSTVQPRHWLVRRIDLLIALSVATLALASCAGLCALPIVEFLSPQRKGEFYDTRMATAEDRLWVWKDVHAGLAARLPGEWTNPDMLVFTKSYRFGSMLSFHRGGRPVVNIAPLYHERNKVGDGQFYYRAWDGLRGAGGVYVIRDGRASLWHLWRMRKLFRKVKDLEPLEIKCGSGRTVRYRIWRVEGFQPNAYRQLRRLRPGSARQNSRTPAT